LAISLAVTLADTGFPQFNPEPGCKAASAINQSIDLTVSQDYEACMKDEESAKQELRRSWSKSTRRLRKHAASGRPRMVVCPAS
jgi:hypothetical protein